MSQDITPNPIPIISARDKIITPQSSSSLSSQVGGWDIGSDSISKEGISLQASAQRILLGNATAPLTGIGIFLGLDGSDYEFRAGDPAGDYIHWNGSDLDIVGNSAELSTGFITLGNTGYIRGGQTAYNTGTGFWMGYDASGGGSYKFSIGNPAGDYLYWDGSNLVLNGSATLVGTLPWSSITNDGHKPADDATVGANWATNLSNIPSTLSTPGANGLYLSSTYLGYYKDAAWTSYIDNSGNFKFLGDANSSIDWNITTPATLTIKGKVVAGTGSSISTSYLSGTVLQANLNIADRGWTQTSVFSVTDSDTVAWGAGTFTSADGTAYSILAGNTGNMAAKTYIYLDIAVSTTVYQTTTTSTTAVGLGKVLIAIAQNATTEATFQVMNGQGGINIDASSIVAGSITANEIAASTITGAKIAADTITSTNISSGYIYAGAINVNQLTAGTISSKSIAMGITAGTGDVELYGGTIASGDFANAGGGSGFILGLDDSDSDKAKYYFGSDSSHTSFDGSNMENVGVGTVNKYTYGETITSGDVVCFKNSYTDITVSEDTYVDYDRPTTNYGDATELVTVSDYPSQNVCYSYYKIALTFVPSDIQRAVLRVYQHRFLPTSPAVAVNSYCRLVTSTWSEDVVTYNTQPTVNDYYSEDQIETSRNSTGYWLEYDITNIVRGWKGGYIDNYGVRLELAGSDPGVYIGFSSREESGEEPHIRIWSNTASDGKIYKAQDGEGSSYYNTIRNVVGIAAESGTVDQIKKVYDTPGSVIGKSITNASPGTTLYVSDTAGTMTSDPTNVPHLAVVGIGSATGDMILRPERPTFIEKYPVYCEADDTVHGFSFSGASYDVYPPKDAVTAVISAYYNQGSTTYKDSVTINRVGNTYSESNHAQYSMRLYGSWANDIITVGYGWTSYFITYYTK